MFDSLKIAAYFLATVACGSLLAPPLFWAGQALGHSWSPLHILAEIEFRRYFDRAILIAALLLIWPAVRALRIGGWRDLGLRKDPLSWRHLTIGFFAAGGLLWVLGIFLWRQGIYTARTPFSLWGSLAAALGSAFAVACLEEGFFRGALQGLVGRTASAPGALVFVAALFAILHFVQPPERPVPVEDVNWLAGFTYLPNVFWQWYDLRLVLGGLATLFAVGLVLGYARWRTRALWLSVGLHAGWVFALKSFSVTSRHVAKSDVWFGEDLRHGLIPVAVVIFTGVVVTLCLQREGPKSGETSASEAGSANSA